MELVCPSCNAHFDRSELKKVEGKLGLFCPSCNEHLAMFVPNKGRNFLISLAIAVSILVIVHVTSVFWFMMGSILISLLISSWMDIATLQKSPPVLKKWKERRKSPPPAWADKGLAKWVFRRNPPQELFDRQEHEDTRDVSLGGRHS